MCALDEDKEEANGVEERQDKNNEEAEKVGDFPQVGGSHSMHV